MTPAMEIVEQRRPWRGRKSPGFLKRDDVMRLTVDGIGFRRQRLHRAL